MWIEWKPVGSNGNLLLSGSMKKGLSLLFVLEEKGGGRYVHMGQHDAFWLPQFHIPGAPFTSGLTLDKLLHLPETLFLIKKWG